MNLRTRWIPFSLLLVSALHAATPLAHIANDDAAVIVALHDVPSILAEWDHSPWAKTWNDEQVKRYFAPLRTQMKEDDWSSLVKEKTGYTLPELLGFATGDALLVVPNFDFALTTPVTTPPVLIGVEVGDNEKKLEELLVKGAKDENAVDETTEFSGVVVHSLQPSGTKEGKDASPTVWAMVEGKWLLSPSKDAVLNAIDAVHNGGARSPWDSSERYARLQQRAGAVPHLIVSLNAEAAYPVLKAMVVAKAKANPQGGPFKFDPEAFLTAFGLDTLREFYFTAQLKDDGTDMRSGLTFSEAKGMTKFLAYRDGPPEMPSFASAKWGSISAAKFSLKDAFGALEEMLENFNPALSGLFQGQIRAFNKQLGIDIKRDFFGSLGDTLVAANVMPADLPEGAVPTSAQIEQFIAISLENPDAFSKSLQALRNSFGPNAESLFKTRDYLGEKIVSVEMPTAQGAPPQKSISYAITKGYFMMSVGSVAPLETALQTMSGHQATIWDKPEVKAIVAQLPPRASALNYQDMRVLVASFFQSLSSAAAMVNGAPAATPVENESGDGAPVKEEPAKSRIPVDPSAQPDLATISKYWDHSWSYLVRDSSGLHLTAQIVYPK